MPVQPATSSKQKYSSNVLKQKTDEEKKEELISAMITKMGDREDEPLPQDDMDGVDSDEWVSSIFVLIICYTKVLYMYVNISIVHNNYDV